MIHEILIAVFFIVGYSYFIYYISSAVQERYWKQIIKNYPVPLYWDAEPECPFCEEKTEVIVGLEDDGQWMTGICPKCENFFYIRPQFKLTYDVSTEKPE